MFQFKAAAKRTKKWAETKALQAMGIALGVAFMISHGPHYQEALIALFDVSSRGLYESIVPDGIARDRGPRWWLLEAFNMPWPIMGIAIALIVVHMRTPKGMVITTGLAVTGALTFRDLSYGIYYGQVEIEGLLVNVAVNALAGILISTAFFLIVLMSLFLSKALGSVEKYAPIMIALTTMITGVVVSLLLYIAMATLLQPLEVEARVVAGLPVNGVIGRTHAEQNGEEQGSAFRFIGKRTRLEKVILNGTRELNWMWTRAEENTRFALRLYVIQGCTEFDQIKKIAKERSFTEIADIEQLRIEVDGFVEEISVEGRQTNVSVERDAVSEFWIEASEEGEGVKLTEFLSDGAVIRGRTRGDVSLFSTAATIELDDSGDSTYIVPRAFRLQIGDQSTRLKFMPADWTDHNDGITCDVVEGRVNLGKVNEYHDVVLGGLYLEIRRTQVPARYLASFDGKYIASGAKGRFRRLNVPHTALNAIAAEELGMIVVQTPIEELYVNGERRSIPTNASFRGHGNIWASYDEGSGIKFSGSFHAAWLDRRRLNATQWELWTTETRFVILSAILSIGLAIGTLVYRTRKAWSVYIRHGHGALTR